MGFTYLIKNDNDSHQSSPAYVLTFTRLSNRDSFNYSADTLSTRNPLVVVNDAISINIQTAKSNPIPTFSCILKQGDINYLTAISPGDFVIVNMVNWETKAMEIRERALQEKAINRHDDGFKGLFKVLDVNMTLSTDPLGQKQYYVQITGRGFDEFNNVLYFNPALVQSLSSDDKTGMLFTNQLANIYDLLLLKDRNTVQTLVKAIIGRTIGSGFSVESKNIFLNSLDSLDLDSLNTVPTFLVPSQVANLLNLNGAKTISNINKYYLGIWQPLGASLTTTRSLYGFANFFEKDNENNFYRTSLDLQGAKRVSFEDFQSVSTWSLLKDYSNPQINESYTCYRIAPDNHVYPSVVVRQKPFSSNHYETKASKDQILSSHTKYLTLPAWKISPDLIYNLNIGRSDKGRINFVQVFARSLTIDSNFDPTLQIISGNFVEDKEDVKRHGRKPYVITCNYAPPESEKVNAKAKEWAYLIADWLFAGHLKLNGTMETVGIEEPICVGDNLDFDDVIYHIESINHIMSVGPNGLKTFKTQMSLSMGVDKKSDSTTPVYGEMDYTDAYSKRLDDFNKENVLPGFSDTQDIPSRKEGEEIERTKEASFTNPASLTLLNKGNK